MDREFIYDSTRTHNNVWMVKGCTKYCLGEWMPDEQRIHFYAANMTGDDLHALGTFIRGLENAID